MKTMNEDKKNKRRRHSLHGTITTKLRIERLIRRRLRKIAKRPKCLQESQLNQDDCSDSDSNWSTTDSEPVQEGSEDIGVNTITNEQLAYREQYQYVPEQEGQFEEQEETAQIQENTQVNMHVYQTRVHNCCIHTENRQMSNLEQCVKYEQSGQEYAPQELVEHDYNEREQFLEEIPERIQEQCSLHARLWQQKRKQLEYEGRKLVEKKQIEKRESEQPAMMAETLRNENVRNQIHRNLDLRDQTLRDQQNFNNRVNRIPDVSGQDALTQSLGVMLLNSCGSIHPTQLTIKIRSGDSCPRCNGAQISVSRSRIPGSTDDDSFELPQIPAVLDQNIHQNTQYYTANMQSANQCHMMHDLYQDNANNQDSVHAPAKLILGPSDQLTVQSMSPEYMPHRTTEAYMSAQAVETMSQYHYNQDTPMQSSFEISDVEWSPQLRGWTSPVAAPIPPLKQNQYTASVPAHIHSPYHATGADSLQSQFPNPPQHQSLVQSLSPSSYQNTDQEIYQTNFPSSPIPYSYAGSARATSFSSQVAYVPHYQYNPQMNCSYQTSPSTSIPSSSRVPVPPSYLGQTAYLPSNTFSRPMQRSISPSLSVSHSLNPPPYQFTSSGQSSYSNSRSSPVLPQFSASMRATVPTPLQTTGPSPITAQVKVSFGVPPTLPSPSNSPAVFTASVQVPYLESDSSQSSFPINNSSCVRLASPGSNPPPYSFTTPSQISASMHTTLQYPLPYRHMNREQFPVASVVRNSAPDEITSSSLEHSANVADDVIIIGSDDSEDDNFHRHYVQQHQQLHATVRPVIFVPPGVSEQQMQNLSPVHQNMWMRQQREQEVRRRGMTPRYNSFISRSRQPPNDMDLHLREVATAFNEWRSSAGRLMEYLRELNESDTEPVTVEDINSHSVAMDIGSKEKDSIDTDCVICISPIEKGEQIRRLPCAHYYHTPCIDRWLLQNSACPICRNPLCKTTVDEEISTVVTSSAASNSITINSTEPILNCREPRSTGLNSGIVDSTIHNSMGVVPVATVSRGTSTRGLTAWGLSTRGASNLGARRATWRGSHRGTVASAAINRDTTYIRPSNNTGSMSRPSSRTRVYSGTRTIPRTITNERANISRTNTEDSSTSASPSSSSHSLH